MDQIFYIVEAGTDCVKPDRKSPPKLELGKKTQEHPETLRFKVHNLTGRDLSLKCEVRTVVDSNNNDVDKTLVKAFRLPRNIPKEVQGKMDHVVDIEVDGAGIPVGGSATGWISAKDKPCKHDPERGHTDWHIDC